MTSRTGPRYRLATAVPGVDDEHTCEMVFESTDDFDLLRLTFPSEAAEAIKEARDRRTYNFDELRRMAIGTSG